MKRKSHFQDPKLLKDTVLNFESSILKSSFVEGGEDNCHYDEKIKEYEKTSLAKLEESELEDYCYYLYLASLRKNGGKDALKSLDLVLEHLCLTKLAPFMGKKTLKTFLNPKHFQNNMRELLNRFEVSENDLSNIESCCYLGLPGYFPYSLCYLVNHKDLDKKNRDIIAFDVLSYFDGFYSAIGNMTITQNSILSVVPLYDGITRGLLLPDVVMSLHSEHFDLISKTVVQGMPANTAYRIANAFMYGIDVPQDREKAKMWYIYGMSVGNPYCTMAYLLFFLDVDAEKEDNAIKVCANIYTFLVNNMMLIIRAKETPNHPFLNFPLQQNGYDIEEVALYNLLSYYNSFKYFSDLDNLPLVSPDFINGFLEYMLDFVSKKDCSNRVKAMYAMFLHIEDVLEEDPVYTESVVSTFKLGKKNCDNYEKILLKILKKGVAENDEASLMSHIVIMSHYHEDKDDADSENFAKLAELGNAQACFSMGNFLMHEKKESQALEYWRIAADEGCTYAMINLALSAVIENDMEKGMKYARRALSYGNVYAYYVFYKYYEKKNPQLSHTYLRYAAEYLFPDAAKELWALKNAGQYIPLPFMQNIEKLEALSDFNVNACIILSEFYSAGVIFPENFLKSLVYRFRSVNNGGTKYFDSFKRLYQNLPVPDIGFGNYFTSFRSSLKKVEGFFSEEPENKDSDDDRRVAFALCNNVIKELCHGKTELEREILFNLSLYGKLTQTGKFLENYTRFVPASMDYNTIYDILKRLLKGVYAVKDLYNDELTPLEIIGESCAAYSNKEYDTYNYMLMKSMLAVRSYFLKPDYEIFRNGIKKSASAGAITGIAFNAIDFSLLFEKNHKEQGSDAYDSLESDVIQSCTVQ